MKPKLTPKQDAFCLAFLKTGNASEAYRQAYNAKAMSAESLHVAACRLLQNANVTLRLEGLNAKAEVKALLSLEEHMEKLRELRDKAATKQQMSAAIKAEELRGKLRRFYVEQHEHGGAGDFSRMSDEELLAILDEPISIGDETRH